MRKFLKVSLLTFVAFIMSYSIYADVNKGKFGIALNYPGLGIKYFLSNKIAVELKGQNETDIFVSGLRGYYYFNPKAKYLLFTGLEADFISFKGKVSEGNGLATELFIGGEYFFIKNLSLQLDLGPTLISIQDKQTSESVSGIEYIVNLGINYYFGGKK